MQPESRKPFQQAFSKNCLPASLFKKLLARKPFQKRLERKPEKRLSLSTLSPNPIGVIKRRNVCGSTFALKKANSRGYRHHVYR
jgi:hypothetical protein